MKRTLAAGYVLLLSFGAASSGERRESVRAVPGASRTLTFEDRVDAQRAIEEVYWRHRIWPEQNPRPKPPLEAIVPDSALRTKVEDSLRKSSALEKLWSHPVTSDELQAELRRIAASTGDGGMLREIFDALHDDASLIAETLVREVLSDRMIRERYASDPRLHRDETSFDSWWASVRESMQRAEPAATQRFGPAPAVVGGCFGDAWRHIAASPLSARDNHVAVWTGSEMIVWSGYTTAVPHSADGARYDPATDTWRLMSLGPVGRGLASAVWTGTEMIVFGGLGNTLYLNSGGRYDPSTNTWRPTSVGANVPAGRAQHVAVWDGTGMIIWGGNTAGDRPVNTGARYDPIADTWRPTSTGAGVPGPAYRRRGIWTGTEMIVWGGYPNPGPCCAYDGGRYNPVSDSWTPTSMVGAPYATDGFSAVWTGTEMIVWGGIQSVEGGRYTPSSDSWAPVPPSPFGPPRRDNTVVWTGSEMIVWGGETSSEVNTGLAYDPATDSWKPTALDANVPGPRQWHTAVWTGSEMIVFGGYKNAYLPDGGRYCRCAVPTLSYRDADGDGYGDSALSSGSCDGSVPAGYVTSGGDCDDADLHVNPGASEACNSIDDDCNGTADEDLGTTTCGMGSCSRTVDNCAAGVPQTCVPGAPSAEVCNGIDDDCNGPIDEGLGQTTCGIGACGRTVNNCANGAPQICVPGDPSPEVCNGIDDDCDGSVDEGLIRVVGGVRVACVPRLGRSGQR